MDTIATVAARTLRAIVELTEAQMHVTDEAYMSLRAVLTNDAGIAKSTGRWEGRLAARTRELDAACKALRAELAGLGDNVAQ